MSDVEYVIWMHDNVKNACSLQQMFGFDDDYLLDMGVSVTEDWPDDVQLEMDPENPTDTLLTDSLFNVSSYLVVSTSLKTALESAQLSDMELLPVGILDHKRKVIPEGYFLVNFKQHYPCLNTEASAAEMSTMFPDEVMSVKGIVLKDLELVKDQRMFRNKGFGRATLVRKDFAQQLTSDGFTGIQWKELSEMKDRIW